MDVDIARVAVEAFNERKCNAMIPMCGYLLPELKELQSVQGDETFDVLFDKIDPNGTVRDTARILGRCKRLEGPNSTDLYLESLRLFSSFEARIRFSLWPKGVGAPHHFSKLLNTRKAKTALTEKEILAILAIFADPKGLNLRNIVLHGFEVGTSLSIPLLRGLSERILPKLPEYLPPEFSFERELKLLHFHKDRVCVAGERHIPFESRFPLLDEFRREIMVKSYELLGEEQWNDAALMLLPLWEQSLRRASIAVLGLGLDRLCASSEEHFVAVKESCEVLPVALQNMVTDLLFAPDGPRLRDHLMHANVHSIPPELVKCLFVLFEQCAEFFDHGENSFFWSLAFHPARCLEFELSFFVPVQGLDLYTMYDSQTYERLIESVKCLHSYEGIRFREGRDWAIMDGRFQRFICACVIVMAVQHVKNSVVQQFVALGYAPVKFGAKNDVERFQRTVRERVKVLQRVLPFCDVEKDYTYDMILDMFDDEQLLEQALEFAKCQIEREHCQQPEDE